MQTTPLIEIQSRVGPDGVLSLTIPVGSENANREVTVTIAGVNRQGARPPMTQHEWEEFVQRTAGSIDDPTFVRPPQGEFEERENPFP
jgi:hypothetical protein